MNQTIVRQIWSRAFATPNKPAVYIPNPNRQTETTVFIAPGGIPSAITVEPDPVAYITWGERAKYIASIMEYLQAQGFKRGDRAAVLSSNCKEIVWFELAVWSLGGISVFVYPNTKPDGVQYILKDCTPSVLVVQNEAQMKKIGDIGIPKIMLKPTGEGAALSSVTPWEVVLNSHDGKATLERMKKELESAPPEKFAGVELSDRALIIYSSGTTGTPKGVVHKHSAIAAECMAVKPHGLDMSENDVYGSYLPMAHVLERINGQACANWYGTPSAYFGIDELKDALKLYKVTVLFGVPLVWTKMMDGVKSELKKAKGFKAKLISWAFKTKPGSLAHTLADFLVFKTIRERLGGHLRLCLTGGARIELNVLEFYQQIGIPLLQGYGLTETCGGACVNTPHNNVLGTCGTAIPGVEVRIVPVPGADDNGSGEVQMRGATCDFEYWGLPEKTAECFVASEDSDTKGKWFKSNDKGKLVNGRVVLEGRIDEVFKLSTGKFIRGALVSKAVGQSDLIQVLYPVGPDRKFLTGLVFIKDTGARDLLAQHGIKVEKGQTAFEIYKTNPEAKAIIDAPIKEALAASATWQDPETKATLEEEERIKKFAVVPEATLDNGLLNETMKLKIKEVPKVFKDVIEELYIVK